MENLMNKVIEILSEDGYHPSIDERDDKLVMIKEGGMTYIQPEKDIVTAITFIEGEHQIFINFYHDDDTFIRMYHYFEEFTLEEREEVLKVSNFVTNDVKHAYITEAGNCLLAICDVYLTENIDIRNVLYYYLGALLNAPRRFYEIVENNYMLGVGTTTNG